MAGTHSGSGKTTISLGLMAAFRRRGLVVAPFKVGPDFIDPGHHQSACGVVSRNLDGWMLPREYNSYLFRRYADSADVAVVEGVMGLFDGYSGRTEDGSTAQMAKWLSLPVLLVLDARSMARSAAAMVYGFEQFDKNLQFAGVVFNRVGSERHMSYLKEALATKVRMPCLGGLPRNEKLCLPERHLGLVTTEEHRVTSDYLDMLADLIEENIDIDTLLASLPDPATQKTYRAKRIYGERETEKLPVRIGVARDKAFCFYYQDNLDLLERYGAELVFFSPLEDPLPAQLNGLYIGGGYPELFAEKLSKNRRLIDEVRHVGQEGLPIYAECGGFMTLCQAIEDLDGEAHKMVGLFPFTVRMLPRLKALGYREIVLNSRCPLGEMGERVRGHEFHYSEIIKETGSVTEVYDISARSKLVARHEGYLYRNVLASYVHLHFGSNPDIAKNFVCFCERRSQTVK